MTGTHGQAFDRLVRCADRIASQSHEPVFIQYGERTMPPVCATGARLLGRPEMEHLIRKARVVVTHGGPGSIAACFDADKVPIVVPRLRKFGEHVDDHQLSFSRRLAADKRILLVENIDELETALQLYAQKVVDCASPVGCAHAARTRFCRELSGLLEKYDP